MMKQSILEFKKNINFKTYENVVLLSAIISYFYSFASRTVYIDSLNNGYYLSPYSDGGLIAGKRWGYYLFVVPFLTRFSTPFLDKFLATVLMVSAGFFLAVLLYNVTRVGSTYAYAIISATFISFPMLTEVWEYEQTNFCVALNGLISILCVYYHINSKESGIRKLFIESFFILPLASTYEAALFFYFTLLLLIEMLLLLYREETFGSWVKSIGCSVASIFISITIKYMVGFFLINVFNSQNGQMGATSILWGQDDFSEVLSKMVKGNLYYYGVRALIYQPVRTFCASAAFAMIVLVIKRVRKKLLIVIDYLLAFLSCFGLSYVQGSNMPYRTAQTIQVFTAVSLFVVISFLFDLNIKKSIKKVIIVLGLFLVLRQSVLTHSLLALSNQVSENEAKVINQIGFEIQSKYSNEKPVVFMGYYSRGDFVDKKLNIYSPSIVWKIDNRFRRMLELPEWDVVPIVDTCAWSYLSWATRTAQYNIVGMEPLKDIFSYYGYDLNILSSVSIDQKEYFESIIKDRNINKYQITDIGDYILVNLG